jgi:hypothetical protein
MSGFFLRGKFIRSVIGTWVRKDKIIAIRIVEEHIADDKTNKTYDPYWIIGRDSTGNVFRLANFEILLNAQESANNLVDILTNDPG